MAKKAVSSLRPSTKYKVKKVSPIFQTPLSFDARQNRSTKKHGEEKLAV